MALSYNIRTYYRLSGFACLDRGCGTARVSAGQRGAILSFAYIYMLVHGFGPSAADGIYMYWL